MAVATIPPAPSRARARCQEQKLCAAGSQSRGPGEEDEWVVAGWWIVGRTDNRLAERLPGMVSATITEKPVFSVSPMVRASLTAFEVRGRSVVVMRSQAHAFIGVCGRQER